uniref:Aldo_ket_red domain-containing protein n=1 Tax=Heterorhabditis bacteriophora TaxID=37862 RepID=A0A1I7XAN6_HETBA
MVKFFDAFDSCSRAAFDGELYCHNLADEVTTSHSIPTIPIGNIEMPMLGLVVNDQQEQHIRVDTTMMPLCMHSKTVAIESGVLREDLFLCSKLWPVDFGSGVRKACKLSCEKLRTDYLGRYYLSFLFLIVFFPNFITDLYMTHFPVVPDWFTDAKKTREETWRQLELLFDEGIIRSIGVSNYTEDDLDELMEYCSVKPHVNQYEFHPWYDPKSLRIYCEENGIVFTGYCPIAKGKILDDPILVSIANKYDKTPAQICLRWSIENGVPAIPKSKEKHRIAENRDVFDFCLAPEDMNALSVLQSNPKKLVKFDDLQEKFCLPDGYKLRGRVYGVPVGPLRLRTVSCSLSIIPSQAVF